MKKIVILSAICLIFFNIVGCKKNPSNSSGDELNQSPSEFTLTGSNFLPSQIVSISLDKPWTSPPELVKIGTVSVQCIQIDNELKFVCPNLPVGKYELEISHYFKSNIQINRIREFIPQEIYDSLSLTLSKNQSFIPSEYGSQFDYWNKAMEQEWAKFNATQKSDFARMIVANNLLDTSMFLNFKSSRLDSIRGRSDDVYDIDASFDEFKSNWILGSFNLRKQIATTSTLLLFSIELNKKFATPLSLGVSLAVNAVSFGYLLKKVAEQNELVEEYLDKTIRAINFKSAETMLSTEIEFHDKQGTLIAPIIDFDNITEGERAETSLNWFFSTYTETNNSLKKVNDILTKLREFAFGNSNDVLWSEKLKSKKVYNSFNVNAKNIEIVNVSNNKIKLTKSVNSKGNLIITAQSDLNEDTKFSFTLEYKGSSTTNKTITKTVDGLFKPTTLAHIGKWLLESTYNEYHREWDFHAADGDSNVLHFKDASWLSQLTEYDGKWVEFSPVTYKIDNDKLIWRGDVYRNFNVNKNKLSFTWEDIDGVQGSIISYFIKM